MFLSYDPDLYVNYESRVFVVDSSINLEKTLQSQIDVFNRAVELTQRSRTYREGERNEFVHLLANNCNRGGIPIEITRQLILKSYGYNLQEVHSTIDSAYSHDDEHGVGLNTRERASMLQRIEDYLRNQYVFRMNAVTGIVEFRRKGDASFKPIKDFEENSFHRDLELNGLNISSSRLATLLRSDFAEVYDPFKEYFASLPPWDGEDHIQGLTQTIATSNDKYWSWILGTWLVAMVASLIDENAINHGVLVLVGAQGLGKTTWIERLVPHELKEYLYSGTISLGNKDTQLHLTECMLINLDELENLNRTEIGELKQIITKKSIRVRKAYGRNNEKMVRRASFAGSVNNPYFLNDTTGSRRFLVAEAVSINLDAKIDLDQVYAQAYKKYNDGFRHWFEKDENGYITEENTKYQIQSADEERIMTWFEPATEANCSLTLTATEIGDKIAELTSNTKRSSSVQIGKVLNKLGYQRKKIRGIYRYPVKLKTHSDVEMVQRGVSDIRKVEIE